MSLQESRRDGQDEGGGLHSRALAERGPALVRGRLARADRSRQLRSLTRLRTAVEPVAAGLAAAAASPGQCRELTVLAAEMAAAARAVDLDAYLVHDIAFHRVVLEASG